MGDEMDSSGYNVVARHFDRDLEKLKTRLLRMGGTVEDLIARSLEALRNRDDHMVAQALKIESEIDAEEVAIEEECLKLIALYQPVAGDLRFIASVLKINAELERMGDLAAHISERARDLASQPQRSLPTDISEMARAVQAMVRRSLESLISQDANIALQVMQADDEVDDHHKQMFAKVVSEIHADASNTETMLELLSVSRYLERIGDSATNIAEDVYYLVEGTIIRHQDDHID
jgi:phosphate transport system protein